MLVQITTRKPLHVRNSRTLGHRVLGSGIAIGFYH